VTELDVDEFPSTPERAISEQEAAGGGNDAAEAIQIAERFDNTAQIFISVTEANARLALHRNVADLRGSRDWLGTAGLFAGFFVSLVTSDFHKLFGLTADTVKGIIMGITFALGMWTAVWAARAVRTPSTEEITERIMKGLKGRQK
jgi:hypothetical protein